MSNVQDHPAIAADAELWRWINPEFWNPKTDRPSSQAFQNSRGSGGTSMSVLLADLVRASGRGPADVVTGKLDGYGLVSFTAGLAREFKQGIVPDPKDDEPAHALVVGLKPRPWRHQFAAAENRIEILVRPRLS